MIVAVDPYLVDWLDLTLRWLHVIAGVVWIGTSFYFVALDNHLAAAEAEGGRRRRRRRRVVGDPRRRLLPRPEVPRRAPHAARAAALVQVGGLHDVAVRLRALLRPLLRRRRPQPRRRRHVGVDGDRDLHRAARRGLARVRRPLPRRSATSSCWPGSSSRSRPWPPTASASCSPIAPSGSSSARCWGRSWWRTSSSSSSPRTGSSSGRSRPAASPTRRPAIRAKQRSVHNNYLTLPVLAGDARRPLRIRLRPRRRLARARVPDARRRLDPALLQPPPRGTHRLVDPGHGRGRAGSDRGLDQAAGRGELHEWDAGRRLPRWRRSSSSAARPVTPAPPRRKGVRLETPRADRSAGRRDRARRSPHAGDAARQRHGHDRRRARAPRAMDRLPARSRARGRTAAGARAGSGRRARRRQLREGNGRRAVRPRPHGDRRT